MPREVLDHAEADEVERAERGRLRPPQRRPRNLVHLPDGESALGQHAHSHQRTQPADAAGRELRPLLRHPAALAQAPVEEAVDGARDFRLRPLSPYQFDQMQVARRVEEVRAEAVCAELFGEAFGNLADRDAARVRGDDRAGLAELLDALEELALDVEVLDDGLDDDVAVLDARQVVLAG